MLKNQYIFARQTGKTGLQFYKFLDQLKRTAKTKDEKEYLTAMQEEWSEFCVRCTLGFYL